MLNPFFFFLKIVFPNIMQVSFSLAILVFNFTNNFSFTLDAHFSWVKATIHYLGKYLDLVVLFLISFMYHFMQSQDSPVKRTEK